MAFFRRLSNNDMMQQRRKSLQPTGTTPFRSDIRSGRLDIYDRRSSEVNLPWTSTRRFPESSRGSSGTMSPVSGARYLPTTTGQSTNIAQSTEINSRVSGPSNAFMQRVSWAFRSSPPSNSTLGDVTICLMLHLRGDTKWFTLQRNTPGGKRHKKHSKSPLACTADVKNELEVLAASLDLSGDRVSRIRESTGGSGERTYVKLSPQQWARNQLGEVAWLSPEPIW